MKSSTVTRILSCATALFVAGVSGEAADFSASGRGTNTAEFLNLGVGARAAAMGGAYSAAADEASALYWNPAAMTQVPKRSVTLMHAAYIAQTYFDYGAYVHNLDNIVSLGMGFQYFSADQISQTDATGANVGSFTPYDLALYWSIAHEIKEFRLIPAVEGFSFGLSAKLVDSRIVTSASAGAVDFGILSRGYFGDHLRLALTATNLGADTMVFDQVGNKLPLAFRIGSACKIAGRWMATLDAVFPKQDQPYGAAGFEYWFSTSGPWKFAGRAGFNSRTIGSIDGFTGASMGFGIGIGGASMDYGFVPYGGLGQAHRFSLTYNF